MLDPLQASLKIGASGLEAQSRRLRVLSENLANANSTGKHARRRPLHAQDHQLRKRGRRGEATPTSSGCPASSATARRYRIEHNPGHPAADAKGFVKLPNVDIMVEVADMREANRSYEANLQVIKQAREMISMTHRPAEVQLMIDTIVPSISPARPRRLPPAPTWRARPQRRSRRRRGRSDFGAMLASCSASAAGALKTAEATSIAGIQGQASVQQVVEAVMSAEQTLQGAIAIRDKVVAAYLELSRMQI